MPLERWYFREFQTTLDLLGNDLAVWMRYTERGG